MYNYYLFYLCFLSIGKLRVLVLTHPVYVILKLRLNLITVRSYKVILLINKF